MAKTAILTKLMRLHTSYWNNQTMKSSVTDPENHLTTTHRAIRSRATLLFKGDRQPNTA